MTASWEDVQGASSGLGLVLLCAIFGAFVAVVVAARFTSRFVSQKNAGLEEWIFAAALPFVIGGIIAISLQVTQFKALTVFAPNEDSEVPGSQYVKIRKAAMAICTCYVTSTCLIKVSILVMYSRIMKSSSRTFTRFIHAAIVFEAIYWITCLATLCFPCRPFAAYYEQYDPVWVANHDFSCLAEAPALLATGAISVSQDFLVAGIPMMFAWKLCVPKRQKIAVCITLGAGLLTCAAGLWRVSAIYEMYWGVTDLASAANMYWSSCITEVLLACTCASAPALKFYFNRYIEADATAKSDDSNVHVLLTGGSVTFETSEAMSDQDYSKYEPLTSTTTCESKDRPTRPARLVSLVLPASWTCSGKQNSVQTEEVGLESDYRQVDMGMIQTFDLDTLVREGIVSPMEGYSPVQNPEKPWVCPWS